MSVPPKYRPNKLSDEVKTYIVIDVHDRAREWTGNLNQIFEEFQDMEKPFFVMDGGGVVQLIYVVSIDDIDSFTADEEEEDAEE